MAQTAHSVIEIIDSAIKSEVLSQLPLIGDLADEDSFFQDLLDVLDVAAIALSDTDSFREFLFTYLGPGSDGDGVDSLDILQNVTTLDDIGNFEGSQTTNALIPEDSSECGRFQLHIGDSIEIPIDFDLGLDAIVFEVMTSGGLTLNFGYDIILGVGLDKATGAFLVTNEGNGPEISLNASVTLDEGTELSLELFFLELKAEQAASGPATGITDASIHLDIKGDEGRLPFSDFTSKSFTELFDVGMNLDAIVNLDLTAGIAVEGFPRLGTTLFVDWGFDAVLGAENAFDGELREFDFGTFYIDMGSYISGVIKPIIDEIDNVLKPLDPLIEFLSFEIPLLSDVAVLLGQDPITVVSLIEIFGEGAETVGDFIDVVITIRQLVKDIASAPDDELRINLGTFDVLSAVGEDPEEKLKNKDTQITPSENGGAVSDSESLDSKINESKGEASSDGFFAGILDTLREIGVTFPILEEPSSAFNLLFGQDVTLIQYDFLGEERLEAGFTWGTSFGPIIPPIPLFAEIFAGFNVFADFAIAFDTFGFRSGQPFDGFHFIDEDPVFGIGAEFGAGANLNLGLAWGGVRGGVSAEIGVGWNDINDDNKFRVITELPQRLSQGLHCVFDLQGRMDVFLEAFAGIGINIFGAKVTIFEKFIELLRATIFEFEVGCPPLPPPVLASVSAGEMLVHIGPNADKRQQGATDGEDKIKIEYDEDKDVHIVSGFDQTQEYEDVTSIRIEAGVEADEIIVDPSVTVPVVVLAGDGDDVVVTGSGDDTVEGGPGNDKLTGGDGMDDLDGGDGDDVLVGGKGDDTLTGGKGDDQARGEDGKDILFGNDGNDDLDGGLAREGAGDELDGGDGDDHLSGGPETDIARNDLVGGPGNDAIEAGGFGDDIDGGSGDDVISGNVGNDDIDAGSGDDIVIADAGDDTVTGGPGNDKIEGGTGNDTFKFFDVNGSETDNIKDIANSKGGGIERLDFSNVTVPVSVNLLNGRASHGNRKIKLEGFKNFEHATGGSDDDQFYDNANNNQFVGGQGDDQYFFFAAAGLTAANHIDEVIEMPGEGRDEINFADLPSTDPLIADISVDAPLLQDQVVAEHLTRRVTTGVDVLRANLENITGGRADDQILGNEAENTLIGNAGDDIIEGRGAMDTIEGNAGEDTILGEDGPDVIFGGANDDTIQGNDGDDEIHGGGGVDFIQGNADDDEIYGDAGNDDLQGNDGEDEISGGPGDDFIFGSAHNDTLRGGTGDDTIFGEDGDDTIEGNPGFDRLFGQAGDDDIDGGPNRDFILGDTENDTIRGGSGDDFISGGQDTGDVSIAFGDDLYGGADHDLVVGGLPTGYEALNGFVGTLFFDIFRSEEFGGISKRPLPTDQDANFDAIDFVAYLTAGVIDYTLPNSDELNLTVNSGDTGTDADDRLHGDAGNDLLVGEEGVDHLFGDWGNDTMFAWQITTDTTPFESLPTTNDRLEGGPDNDDPMCGTHGENLMIGGTSDVNLVYTLGNEPPFQSAIRRLRI